MFYNSFKTSTKSYGCVIKDFVRDKDAVQAVLTAAEAGNFYKKQGKDLVDVLDSLYDRHGTYEESQVALSLAGEAGAKRIKEILATLRKDAPTEIGGTKVVRSEDYKECTIKEGDTVLYGKYAGTELEFDGTKYIMMRQSDVLAVVEE